jgi:hypothetical protein
VIARSASFPKSARLFGCAIFLMTILNTFSGPKGVFAAEEHHPFATFTLKKMDIDIEDGEIDMLATFTVGTGSNGLELSKEPVTLQITGGSGAYSVTIPPGSFKADRTGAFRFQGSINRVKVDATVRPGRGAVFDFEIETENANLKGFKNPVTVTLAIGDDGGSKTVKAEIE